MRHQDNLQGYHHRSRQVLLVLAHMHDIDRPNVFFYLSQDNQADSLRPDRRHNRLCSHQVLLVLAHLHDIDRPNVFFYLPQDNQVDSLRPNRRHSRLCSLLDNLQGYHHRSRQVLLVLAHSHDIDRPNVFFYLPQDNHHRSRHHGPLGLRPDRRHNRLCSLLDNLRDNRRDGPLDNLRDNRRGNPHPSQAECRQDSRQLHRRFISVFLDPMRFTIGRAFSVLRGSTLPQRMH